MSSPGSSSNEGMDDVPDFVEEEEEELEEMEEDEEGEDGYGSDDYIIESDHDTGYSSGEENNELKDQKEAFFAACKNGDIEAVKQFQGLLLARLIDSREQRSRRTPLMVACKNGHVEVVQYLLENGANMVAQCIKGWGAMEYAIKGNHSDVLQVLLDHQSPSKDKFSRYIMTAVLYGSLACAKLLYESGAQVSVVDPFAGNLVTLAASNRDLTMLRWLHSLNIDPNVPMSGGNYPIHLLARHGYLEPLKFLIEEMKPKLDVQNDVGRTALDIANEWNMREAAVYLFECGVDPSWDKKNNSICLRTLRPVTKGVRGRDSHAMTAVGSKIILFGGMTSEGAVFYDAMPTLDLFVLDLNSIKMQRIIPEGEPTIYKGLRLAKSGSNIAISEDGLSGQYVTGSNRRAESVSIAVASEPFTKEKGFGYFEMTVIDPGVNRIITIGLTDANYPLNGLEPGWRSDSFGFHGDGTCATQFLQHEFATKNLSIYFIDGAVFRNDGRGCYFGEGFAAGDVIGCGINWETGIVWFTKNGEFLGAPFSQPEGKEYYATVGSDNPGTRFEVNFGAQPFRFNFLAPTFTWQEVTTDLKGLDVNNKADILCTYAVYADEESNQLFVSTTFFEPTTTVWIFKLDEVLNYTPGQILTSQKVDSLRPIHDEEFEEGMRDMTRVGDYIYIHISYVDEEAVSTVYRMNVYTHQMEYFIVGQNHIDERLPDMTAERRVLLLRAIQMITDGGSPDRMTSWKNYLVFLYRNSNRLILLDPETLDIREQKIHPFESRRHAGLTTLDNYVCMHGGFDSADDPSNVMQMIDPDTGSVVHPQSRGSMVARPRGEHAIVKATVSNPIYFGYGMEHKKNEQRPVLAAAFGVPYYFVSNLYHEDVEIFIVERDEPDELISLLSDNSSSDIQLVLPNGERINAHRFILYCRSEYFKQELDNKPNAEAIEIPPTDPALFKALIKYLYSDCLDFNILDSHDTFRSFLKLVDKFAPAHRHHITELYLLSQKSKISNMSANMAVAFESANFADIKLNVGGETFLAHKALLCVRNEYFNALLTGGLRESHQKEVTISDMDPEAFRIVLKHIYTKSIDDTLEAIDGSNVIKVFQMACLFGISRLRIELENLLVYNLTLENVIPLLLLAERQAAPQLLHDCLEFVAAHLEELKDTPDYKQNEAVITTLLNSRKANQ